MRTRSNSGVAVSTPLDVPVQDPLVGIPRPKGNPWMVFERARAFTGAGNELTSVHERLNGSVQGTVGASWIGRAGSSCREAVRAHASEYAKAGTQAHEAGSALAECANRWQSALWDYDRARTHANEAMEDEIAYRERAQREADAAQSSGDEGRASVIRSAAESYESPQRSAATRTASAAIHDFNAATEQACGKLDALGAPIRAAINRVGVASGVMLGPSQRLAEHAADHWVRHVPGKVGSDGKLRGNHVNGEYVKPGGVVPDDEMRDLWAKRAAAMKYGGHVIGFATAGGSQWLTDTRSHPDMDTDERVGRAVTAGTTAAVGGAVGSMAGRAGGAWAGAAIGTLICPGPGTVIGAVIGGLVGGIGGGVAGGWAAGKLDDPVVDEIGNLTDKWDQLELP